MQKLLNLDYSLIQAIYWMLYSVAGVFVSVVLLDKGYSNAAIGAIIAVGSLLAIFLQVVLTNIADKIPKITNMFMIKIMIALLLATVLMVLFIGEKTVALTIAYVSLIIIHTALHPFVNALSFTLEKTGYKVSYGLGRSMGSLFAGLLALVLGFLIVKFSTEVVLHAAIVNLVLMTIVVFTTESHFKKGILQKDKKRDIYFRKVDSSDLNSSFDKEKSITMLEFIQRNHVFVFMSIGVVGLFFGNVVIENFTYQIVEGIGGSTENMGVIIGLLSVLEMPAMLGFAKLKDKFSYVFLIRTAAVFITLKIPIMYFGNSMVAFYLAQFCSVPGYGLLFPAMVSFIDSIMDKGEAFRGQAVFTAAITVGNLLGCVFGGMILDIFDSRTLLFIASLISLVGTIIVVMLVKKVKCS